VAIAGDFGSQIRAKTPRTCRAEMSPFPAFPCLLAAALAANLQLKFNTVAAALGCWTGAIYHAQCQRLHSQNYICQSKDVLLYLTKIVSVVLTKTS